MNNHNLLTSFLLLFLGGGVSAANIFEVLQPAIGIIVGLLTVIGAIILIKINLVRLKNLRIDNQIKQKQLNGLK